MTISYLGNFKFPWCTEEHAAKTLEQLGHAVIRLQEDDAGLDYIVANANASDLFFWTRTYDMLKCDGFEMLRQIKVPTISFHLDYYFGISRQTRMDQDAFWRSDFVFQPDGDHQDEFKAMGIHSYWLPPGCFKDGCYLLQRSKTHDLIFVGSHGDYHGEWPWRRELINHCFSYPQFVLYPQGEAVREEKLNELYASTKVVIGDSLSLPGNKTYTSDRIFETTGRGGFIIYPRIEYVVQAFGDALATYEIGNWSDLRGKIDYYLDPNHEAEREEMRLKCHEITKTHHTYHQRFAHILEVVNEKQA